MICGAGASFDSSLEFPAPARRELDTAPAPRPPLTRDLFDPTHKSVNEVLNQWKEVAPIASLIRREQLTGGGRQFEEILEALAAEAEDLEAGAALRPQLLTLRFYLAALLSNVERGWVTAHGSVTAYTALCTELERWRSGTDAHINFITFNYDTLLDQALEAFGPDPKWTRRDGGRHESVRLFKVHGSIDWSRRVNVVAPTNGQSWESKPAVNAYYEAAYRCFADPSWCPAPPFSPVERLSSTLQAGMVGEGPELRVPALAIPTLSKSAFELPDGEEDELREALRRTDRVMVIGWAGKEAHFAKLVHNVMGPGSLGQRLLIVDVADRILTTMQSVGAALGHMPSGPSMSFAGEGFSGFLRRGDQLFGQWLRA